MGPIKKAAYLDRQELRDNIESLAAEIRAGEENVMEDYEKAVKVFAELTRCVASAKETDPIAWESFIEDGGHSETNLPYAGGNRGLNYLEMVKFNRGYWR